VPRTRPTSRPAALPEAWVVRIYRRPLDPGEMVGEAERVGGHAPVRFHGVDELSALLTRAPRRARARRP
jgi:hypothetical protein